VRIGELAERVDVRPGTIRYYEDIGLLPSPPRRPSGYREYGPDDVGRLAFVRTAQRLGLALAEISEILSFRERGERPCAYVLGILDTQVGDLDRRIAEMERLRDELVALKGRADRLPDDEDCYCAVIEHSQADRPVSMRPAPSGGAPTAGASRTS
jgi:DNA-binding transcriptional MerR regulator